MAFMFGLLVANELPRFRELGPVVRVATYALCLSSYFAYLLPVLLGFVSWQMFVLSIALSAIPVVWLYSRSRRWTGSRWAAMKRVGLPALGTQALLVALYFAKVIPPVPLAVQFIGVYHAVEMERADPGKKSYRLLHQKPVWRFWEQGDQTFYARSGDEIFVFASIFAPSRFEDPVSFNWFWYDEKRGWRPRGVYNSKPIVGGREQGFRNFSKAAAQPGEWKVEVQAVDGRVIGSIRLKVYEDPDVAERIFTVDRV
jgi:hypothetical protein